jgi:hypothetical protein
MASGFAGAFDWSPRAADVVGVLRIEAASGLLDEKVVEGRESRILRKACVADIEAHVPARRERLGQHRQRRAAIRYRIGIEAKARGIATRRSGARGNVDETNRVARGVASHLDDRRGARSGTSGLCRRQRERAANARCRSESGDRARAASRHLQFPQSDAQPN